MSDAVLSRTVSVRQNPISLQVVKIFHCYLSKLKIRVPSDKKNFADFLRLPLPLQRY